MLAQLLGERGNWGGDLQVQIKTVSDGEKSDEEIPMWYKMYLDLLCLEKKSTDITHTTGAVFISTTCALEGLNTFKPGYSEV